MNFDSIIGQREITEGLSAAIKNGKVGHAYIFTGPRGIGKRTVAEIFAGMLLCTGRSEPGSCGECLPCRLFAGGSNPDFTKVEIDELSIKVDEIRSAIQEDVVIKPMYSGKKVYIINDADKMTTQAQNCLLKTLEEPPCYAVFILLTANYQALLETIRSRAVKCTFKKNSNEEVRNALKVRFGDNEKLDFIASYADGVIGAAMELAGSGEFVAIRDKTAEIIMRLARPRLLDVFNVYGFFEENKENIDIILDIMLLFYRDMLLMIKSGEQNMLINSDKKDIILGNAGNFTVQKLISNIDTVEQTRMSLNSNANYQLSIEVMLMKLQEEMA